MKGVKDVRWPNGRSKGSEMKSWKRFATNKSILSLAVLVLMLMGGRSSFAQQDTAHGSPYEARRGLLAGNQVEATFYNFGEFGDWMNQPVQSFNWPRGSGHLYIAGTAFIVQARAVTQKGNVIHPLETNYYEYTRRDPLTGITYGWWPLPGYARANQSKVAQSNDSLSWPAHWPDKPGDWDGSWNGYFGKGVKAGLTETYFVMDDNYDREYIGGFHPDSSDTTRGGLGLKVRVRAMEWEVDQLQDILFVSFVFSNEGTTSYDSMYAAQYVDYAIGGYDNSSNNFASFLSPAQLFVAQSTTTVGQPGNWSPVGLLGIEAIATPDSQGFTGVRTFPVHTHDLDNDESNWAVISSSGVDLVNTSGVNAVCFLSSGPFTLAPGEEKRMLLAYSFANDTVSLKAKADFARRFYESGFVSRVNDRNPELPNAFALLQNYPNPFNPSTTIRYGLPHSARVILNVYNTLGQAVATLVNDQREAGHHEVRFDGSSFASGVYYYRMQAGGFVQTKRLMLLK
jgi:hypothetical protein